MSQHRIIVADVLDGLRTLPDESVQCVVTSPPYWSLRDYGVPGQIGLEPTPQEYVEKMVAVFREVRRVLRSDGTAWVNMGDGYAQMNTRNRAGVGDGGERREVWIDNGRATAIDGLKPKDLIGMPWRLAFALQSDGWWLRSDIIWSKPNPMPESVTDRPTKAHEYVFLLAKEPRYFFDAEAVREASTERPSGNTAPRPNPAAVIGRGDTRHAIPYEPDGSGRNLRSVWTIPTQPFLEAHFATFPEKLVEPCVKAGTSERGCCPKCGAPWERLVERSGGTIGKSWHDHENDGQDGNSRIDHGSLATAGERPYRRHMVGFEPGCDCRFDPPFAGYDRGDHLPQVPCRVLDPFAGSGTVGVVACRMGRDFIGIELNPQYAAMAERRIGTALRPSTYRDEQHVKDAPLFEAAWTRPPQPAGA